MSLFVLLSKKCGPSFRLSSTRKETLFTKRDKHRRIESISFRTEQDKCPVSKHGLQVPHGVLSVQQHSDEFRFMSKFAIGQSNQNMMPRNAHHSKPY